jgi:hypothetical protein
MQGEDCVNMAQTLEGTSILYLKLYITVCSFLDAYNYLILNYCNFLALMIVVRT